MDLALAFLVFAAAMCGVLALGLSMSWAMLAGFAAFLCVGLRRGFHMDALLKMSLAGIKDSLIVVRVMLTIGILTGLWRSAGTFAILTAWGLRLISPGLFIPTAFLLSCVLSYAIGTSFGTAGTLGVALMTLARSGGVNELVTAGAVMSGIYFGDRCSPASSCAHLVASLTGTDLYGNISLMMKTSLLPFILSLGFYFLLSFKNPMSASGSGTLAALAGDFNLSPLAALPAVVMLVLPPLKIKIFHAFLASIVCAFLCTVFLQDEGAASALLCALNGLHAPAGSTRAIFNGGGLVSMLELSFVLAVSGTYSGIFDGTGMLKGAQERIGVWLSRFGAFPVTAAVSTMMDAAFCNQTIGVMMTTQLMRRPCEQRGLSREELAQDIANSGVVTAGLIPWCIACSVPFAMFNVSFGAVIWSVYLYLLPLCYALTKRRWFRQ